MKRITPLRLSIVLSLGLFILNGFSQEIDNSHDNNQNHLVNTENNIRTEIVINTKMINRFKSIYDEIEVISFNEVLENNTFEDFKSYYNAYCNLDLNAYYTLDFNAVKPQNPKESITQNINTVIKEEPEKVLIENQTLVVN